jgi:hypothetical protein
MNMNKILPVVFGIALIASACSDPVPPATPTPATPTITDTFNGSLTPLSTNSHPFVVNQVGGISVTLTTVTPVIQLSIGIGTPSTTTGLCVVNNLVTTGAGTTPQLSGTATIPGNYCLSVHDPGNVIDTATYTVTILHS